MVHFLACTGYPAGGEAGGEHTGDAGTQERTQERRQKRQGPLFSLKDSLSFLYPAVSCTDIFQLFPSRFLFQLAFAVLALS